VTSASASLTIAARFAGPPHTGNGGYTAGRLASYLATVGPVTVTLWKPPPLDRALDVDLAAGEARLMSAGEVVAIARLGNFEWSPPEAVSVERAAAAEAHYAGRREHPFPTCFVCGTSRAPGDGMRLAPGRDAQGGRTACVWTPDPSLASPDDVTQAAPEFVWAALDCPGGWASEIETRPLVLGRMTAVYDRLPAIAEAHVVVGALRGGERRKIFTTSALYDSAGSMLARAEHTWIAVDPGRF
jgi:hypothetical protein